MPLKPKLPLYCTAVALVALAAPALADVKAGVDAWSHADYATAVKEWQGPADAGDADAMFNLAQAYRMGRGVAADPQRAEALYAKAAAAGHQQARDTYGLMLFQDGKRAAALPYLQDAARRGDPRSQYLLGIAHFNGDLVAKDWVRAYALVTLANAAGLPQAAAAIAQMDQHIPLEQRQQAQGVAQQLRAEAESARSAQLAAADLAPRQAAQPVARAAIAPTPVAFSAPRPTASEPTLAVSPSIAAARQALAEASRATGTENPGEAGASFGRPRPVARPPEVVASPRAPGPAPAQLAKSEAPKAHAPVAQVAGPRGAWRVQLGAFAVAGNAQQLWQKLSSRPELAGKQRLMVAAGAVTKLQAGGYPSREAADEACRALQHAGQACLVTER